jgi:hypothetical protein
VETGTSPRGRPYIPVVRRLLRLFGQVRLLVTVDAMHTQTATAKLICGQLRSHYLMIVKSNQCATRRFDTSPPQAGQIRREVCWVR